MKKLYWLTLILFTLINFSCEEKPACWIQSHDGNWRHVPAEECEQWSPDPEKDCPCTPEGTF